MSKGSCRERRQASSQGVRLGRAPAEGRRGAGDAVPRDARAPVAPVGDARRDFQEGASRHPEPGDAQAPDRRPNRAGELARDGRGREGRHLRRAACQERGRVAERRGPILHATRAHQGDRGCDAARPGRLGMRPGMRDRWLSPRRARVRDEPLRQEAGSRSEEAPAYRVRPRDGACTGDGAPRDHEPAAARRGRRSLPHCLGRGQPGCRPRKALLDGP